MYLFLPAHTPIFVLITCTQRNTSPYVVVYGVELISDTFTVVSLNTQKTCRLSFAFLTLHAHHRYDICIWYIQYTLYELFAMEAIQDPRHRYKPGKRLCFWFWEEAAQVIKYGIILYYCGVYIVYSLSHIWNTTLYSRFQYSVLIHQYWTVRRNFSGLREPYWKIGVSRNPYTEKYGTT